MCRPTPRNTIFSGEFHADWESIWGAQISDDDAGELLKIFEQEINQQPQYEYADYDIAYAADVACRIAAAQIVDVKNTDITGKAQALVSRAAQTLPALATYQPAADQAPDVSDIIAEIDRLHPEDEDEEEEDEIPF